MKVIPANAQNVGARQEQQDAFGFTDIDDATFVEHGGVLAVVADGMGGLAMGRQASQSAVQTILTAYAAKSPDISIPEVLTQALHQANAAVLRIAEEAGFRGNVGTTVVAAVIYQSQLHWISAGDSRLYLYRQGTLTQLTTDHSFAAELARAVERADLTPEQAARHPERHSLTSYVGLPSLDIIDASETPLSLQADDRILLCSDGLYGTLDEKEMASVLAGNSNQVADTLIETALKKQHAHQDNLTAVVMTWEADERPRQPVLPSKRSPVRFSQPAILGAAFLIVLLVGFALGYWQAKQSLSQGSECRSAAGADSSASSLHLEDAATVE